MQDYYECSFARGVILMSFVKLVLHRKICYQSFSTKTLHKYKQTMDRAICIGDGTVLLFQVFILFHQRDSLKQSINVQFSCILENKIFLINCQ